MTANPFPIFQRKKEELVREKSSIHIYDDSKKKVEISIYNQRICEKTGKELKAVVASTKISKKYIRDLKAKFIRELEQDEHPDNIFCMEARNGNFSMTTTNEEGKLAVFIEVKNSFDMWESVYLCPADTEEFLNLG